MNRWVRQVARVATAAGLAVVLAACGSSGDSSDTTTSAAGTQRPRPPAPAVTPARPARARPARPARPARGTATFEDPSQGVTTTQVDWGIIYDQTGPTASTQVPFGNGIIAAFNAKNAEGGVLGRKINPVTCDEKYEVAAAVACLKNMVSQEPVVGFTGLNNSSFQAAGVPLVQAAKLPVIGPESTSKDIVNPFPGWVWATECTYPNQADVLVAYAAKKLGKTDFTAVGLGGNVASADAYLGQVQARVEKAGAKYLETIHYEYGAPNLDQQAQQIAADKPDVIFTHGGTGQNVLAFKSLEKYGVTDTLVLGIFAQVTDPIAESSQAVGKNYWAVDLLVQRQADRRRRCAGHDQGGRAVRVRSGDLQLVGLHQWLRERVARHRGPREGRRPADPGIVERGDADHHRLRHPGAVPEHHVRAGELRRASTRCGRTHFNYDTKVWEPDGSFEDYEACNSHEFQNGNIDAWSVDCIGS